MLIRAVEHGPHRRGPPLASALTGRDIVTVEPARDLGEGGPTCVLAVDAGDHVGRECRLAPGPCDSPPPHPRLRLSLGEVPLEFADRDQPRAPLGLDGRDRWYNAPVESGQADAERLSSLLARIHEAVDRSADTAVVRRERADGPGRVPLFLLASASPSALGQRSPPYVHTYSNAGAGRHRMMHLCLACYRCE